MSDYSIAFWTGMIFLFGLAKGLGGLHADQIKTATQLREKRNAHQRMQRRMRSMRSRGSERMRRTARGEVPGRFANPSKRSFHRVNGDIRESAKADDSKRNTT